MMKLQAGAEKQVLNIKNQVDKMLRCLILNPLNGKPYNFK
jgi:hypothetical protein